MSALSDALSRDALQIRRRFLKMHYEARAGHVGTGLSAIDILTYVYRRWRGAQDVFILSKGHGASALYATLHHVGLLTDAVIDTYYKDGTLLPAHPAANALSEIPAATGSLGHGLPIANGLAYAKHVLRPGTGRVACLLSDGECNEGSVWEAALFAGHHHLNNLVAIVDANGLQGFGRTEEVLNMEPLEDKWAAFGFKVVTTNGHDFEDLHRGFSVDTAGAPLCIIARTTKGKGLSFWENKLESHYLPLSEALFQQALSELDAAEAKLSSHAS